MSKIYNKLEELHTSAFLEGGMLFDVVDFSNPTVVDIYNKILEILSSKRFNNMYNDKNSFLFKNQNHVLLKDIFRNAAEFLFVNGKFSLAKKYLEQTIILNDLFSIYSKAQKAWIELEIGVCKAKAIENISKDKDITSELEVLIEPAFHIAKAIKCVGDELIMLQYGHDKGRHDYVMRCLNTSIDYLSKILAVFNQKEFDVFLDINGLNENKIFQRFLVEKAKPNLIVAIFTNFNMLNSILSLINYIVTENPGVSSGEILELLDAQTKKFNSIDPVKLYKNEYFKELGDMIDGESSVLMSSILPDEKPQNLFEEDNLMLIKVPNVTMVDINNIDLPHHIPSLIKQFEYKGTMKDVEMLEDFDIFKPLIFTKRPVDGFIRKIDDENDENDESLDSMDLDSSFV